MKYSSEQYIKVFDKLPQEIKDVVASLDVSNRIWAIGEKHKLHIDKIGIMHDIARDVMMGIIAGKDFVKELQNGLGIPALDASTIARDIDDEIFKPIKQIMINNYGEGAPNKPSSSLVQFYEEDAEHPSLDKDTLLKEIENPPEAKPRVEKVPVVSTTIETKEEVLDLERMQKNVSAQAPKPVEVKKDEPVKPVATTPQVINPAPNPNISSTLEKLASMKLTGTFVMPKEGGLSPIALNKELKPALPTEDKSKLSAATTPPVIVAKPDATPYIQPNAKYPVDPYREPAN